MPYNTKTYHIYIVSNKIRTVYYIGVSSDLERRIYEHQNNIYPNSFTSKYNCKYLIYYEESPSIKDAISREKQLKKWNKQKKLDLIQTLNPKLRDLSTGSR
jgi:putative endonuclease